MGMAMLKVISDASVNSALVLVDIPMIQKQYAAKMSKEDIEKQHGSIKYSDFKATGEQQKLVIIIRRSILTKTIMGLSMNYGLQKKLSYL